MGVNVRVLSLPDDVLLSVLRRCARADWLSLACSCRALRAAAAQDAPVAVSARAAATWRLLRRLPPSRLPTPLSHTQTSQHSRAASASSGTRRRGQQGKVAQHAPGVPPRKRKRVRADPTDEADTGRTTMLHHRGQQATGQPAAAVAADRGGGWNRSQASAAGGRTSACWGRGGSDTRGCETWRLSGRCRPRPLQEAARVKRRGLSAAQRHPPVLPARRGEGSAAVAAGGAAARLCGDGLAEQPRRARASESEPDQTALPLS